MGLWQLLGGLHPDLADCFAHVVEVSYLVVDPLCALGRRLKLAELVKEDLLVDDLDQLALQGEVGGQEVG